MKIYLIANSGIEITGFFYHKSVKLGYKKEGIIQLLGQPTSRKDKTNANTSKLRYFGNNLILEFEEDILTCIEIIKNFPGVVFLNNINVFLTPSSEISKVLGSMYKIEIKEKNTSYYIPDLAVGFWREYAPEFEGDNTGRFFDTCTVQFKK